MHKQPDKLAFTFLPEGSGVGVELTYGELDARARRLAVELKSLDLAGQRALLIYPAGIDYIVAFFGCMYAGVVAVPAYPPRPNRSLERIETILSNCQPKIALTTAAVLESIERRFSDSPTLRR